MSKAALFLVLACLLSCVSAEPNLVKNASFDRSSRHWSLPGWKSSGAWRKAVAGRGGVLSVTETMVSQKHAGQTGDISAASQCIPIAPGVEYDISGRAFLPSGQSEDGYAVITVVWWKNRRCTMGSSDPNDDMFVIRKDTGRVEQQNRWQYIALCGFKPPEGAQAAEISLNAVNTTMSLNGTFSAFFDDIVFQPHVKECTFLETY